MRITDFRQAPGAVGLMLLLSLAMAMAMAIGRVMAAEKSSQSDAGGAVPLAVTVEAEQLIELYQSIPNLAIIDSRHREDHAQGYIERSHNLPLSETNCESLSRIATNSEQALVFYCNGTGVDASIDAIHIASSCGYRRLFWLSGGFIEWRNRDYPFVID
jgi:rhodanese-related sulfurtransferase